MLKSRLLLFAIPSVLMFSCQSSDKSQVSTAMPFPTVKAIQKELSGYYTFPTEISGQNNNQVRPKISGYIKEVYVDEGQHVKAGTLLFKLETNILDQTAGAAQSQVTASQANIKTAEAQVKAAQVEVDKLVPLVEKGIISEIQLETARANLLKAKGQLSQAKAGLDVSRANYQGINENIKFSNVKAPIDGIVGKINYKQGALVGPNNPNPLTTVSDISRVFAYFSLNETQYINFFQIVKGKDLDEKISKIPPVELELANGKNFDELGKVEAGTGQIDPSTGTIQFRVAFENKNKMLNNGNSGKIKIPRYYGMQTVVPESATFEQQGFTYVYKVVNDTVRMTPVEIIDRAQNYAIIKTGIQIGDMIVASGIMNLRPGMPITSKPVALDSLVQTLKPIQ